MNTTALLSSGKAGLLAITLLTLTSCDPFFGMGGYGGGYGNSGYGYGSYGYPAGLSAYAPRSANAYNYSYYPRYGAYYHHPTQQYHYMSGNNWMSGPRMPGFSHNTIQASHSVPFNFNNHPSNYHSQVSQSFPRSWSPPAGGNPNGSHGGGWNGGGGGWNGHRH